MTGTIFEFFGFQPDDSSTIATESFKNSFCPFIQSRCEKTFNDGIVSGVCTVKPMTSQPVICCPNRLYGDEFRILKDVALIAFESNLPLKPGNEAKSFSTSNDCECVAVFGKKWGRELRLPQKGGRGSYFVDWVLAKINSDGELVEFVAIEVQTIDTTENYRNGFKALTENRKIIKTTVGLNWENVSKRILPQIIYKGQVLQREKLCKKGLSFICPLPICDRLMERLGGEDKLVKYALQPASITFLSYDFDLNSPSRNGQPKKLIQHSIHSTTVYKVQEAFNNVTLPDKNVYQAAVLNALG